MTASGTTARPTIVVSDIHLGEIPPDGEQTFLSFLESLPGKIDELLINGDLFDFWFEYRSVILRRYFPVLRRLADPRPLSDAERDEAYDCYETEDFKAGCQAIAAKVEPAFKGR